MPRRVVVIGGGIIGLSTAYYALQKGFDVTVLDRDSADSYGCSWGNSGLLVPSHFVPLAAPGMVQLGLKMLPNRQGPFGFSFSLDVLRWMMIFARHCNPRHVERSQQLLVELCLASVSLYENLASDLGVSATIHKRGLAMICRDSSTLAHELAMVPRAAKLGLNAVEIQQKDLQKLGESLEIVAKGGVMYNSDSDLTPGVIVQALRDQLGDRIKSSCEVKSVIVENGKVSAVKTSKEEFVADEFVLAAGSWSGELANDFGLKMPMVAGKGYSLTLPNPPSSITTPMILVEGRVAITPMTGGTRFGGTMELTRPDLSINQNRLAGIKKSVESFLPQFKEAAFQGVEPWVGLRPCSPDGLPYIGRAPNLSNLTVATGHAMMGMTLGPITGHLVTQLLCEEPPNLSLELLKPNRFC
ncbi:MAG: FAD-dependent oxidoreductase [Armatimonadetes bacterium]|nr:FAD-dependent oxidoreductase [Armatimonadota bacterium]